MTKTSGWLDKPKTAIMIQNVGGVLEISKKSEVRRAAFEKKEMLLFSSLFFFFFLCICKLFTGFLGLGVIS